MDATTLGMKVATTHYATDTLGTINVPASSPQSLRRNFSWTLLGNVTYAACQWGMLVVLAKFGSPEMVGQFALGLAVTAPVILFASLALRSVQVTDARHQYLFGDYLGLRLITTVLALLVILGLTFMAGYRRETALVVVMVGVAKAIESVSDIFYGLLQRHERMDLIATSMLLKGPLSLAALSIGVYLTGSVLGGVLGLTAAWALILVGYDMPVSAMIFNPGQGSTVRGAEWTLTALRPRWKAKTLGQLAWLTFPLGLSLMLLSLNANIPRYFIERYWGERELGIFAALAQLMVVGGMVVNALGQSASPRLARYHSEKSKSAFLSLLLKLIGIGGLLGITGVLVVLIAGREVLTFLYRAEYADHVDAFVWVMVAAGLWYIASMIGYAATASRRIYYQPFALGGVIAASFLVCYGLVGTHGLWGAAISMVAASVVGVLSYSLLFIFDRESSAS